MAKSATAAGRVEFVIGTEPGVQGVSLQQWYRLVTDAGAAKLDIRSARAGDQFEIVTRDSAAGAVHVVHGRLSSRGELVVPGGQFRVTDRARLSAWIKKLASDGPAPPAGEARPFGLAPAELARVRADLGRPVDLATQGIGRRAAIEGISRELAGRVDDGGQLAASILSGDTVNEELRGLSRGTSLACLLRPAGLVLVPRNATRGEIEYRVVRADDVREAWPVGLPSETSDRELLPGLFDFLTAEVANRPVTDVIAAVAAHIEAPILFDHYALAAREIDPTKALVKHPEKRTYYLALLRSSLFQAKLSGQLRVDEAGKPFVWVTTIEKP